MNDYWQTASLLWRYLNLYWLKPFDAVNDTATASMLLECDWSGSIVETGSGDGVYSFIMHGGSFPLWYDRYLLANVKKKDDIYDYHKQGVLKTAQRANQSINAIIALDRKYSHLQKVKEINFYRLGVQCKAEFLPLRPEGIDTLFCYFFHGMEDHGSALVEASKVIKKGGKLLILLFNNEVRSNFICYRIARWAKSKNLHSIASFFRNLDSGRHDELTAMSRSLPQWQSTFTSLGLRIEKAFEAISPFAWCVYDIQTRPLLKPMIRLIGYLDKLKLRTPIKLIIMTIEFPFLLLFYNLFAQPRALNCNSAHYAKSCILAFQLVKVSPSRE